MNQSDEYWKLYENYTGALKKIAEVQDTLETTKKDLSEAQTQSKSPYLNVSDAEPGSLLIVVKLVSSTWTKLIWSESSKSTIRRS